jgi:ADP-ribose pyrophosphatase
MSEILSKQRMPVSPWIELAVKEVRMPGQQEIQIYHAVSQSDYIAILARTTSGLIPLVRQFRPAVEMHTWELPAGLVEQGEDPRETCRRELIEETGLVALEIIAIQAGSRIGFTHSS